VTRIPSQGDDLDADIDCRGEGTTGDGFKGRRQGSPQHRPPGHQEEWQEVEDCVYYVALYKRAVDAALKICYIEWHSTAIDDRWIRRLRPRFALRNTTGDITNASDVTGASLS
jgi:hypothetical protein